MQAAKDGGFWIVKLYVQVSFETSLARNAKRESTVPRDVLATYVEQLDDAVKAVTAAPDELG